MRKIICIVFVLFFINTIIAIAEEPILLEAMITERNKKIEINIVKAKKTKKILHIIKKGDTLSKLSKKYKISILDLAKKNNIKNINLIYIGNILVIQE